MDGLSLAAKSIRPRVGAIGTCRIFSPLHYLERNTRIIAVKDPLKWYTHSIPEAIQKIRIIRGEVTIPSSLVPFIVYEVDRFDPLLYRPGYYEAAEVFVIEVSAINTVQWRNVELQRWCMRDAFQAAGIDYSRLLRLLNAPPESRNLSGVPEALRYLAAESRQRRQTPEAMMSGLYQLRQILQRPLVIVGALNVDGSDGKPIPERAQINDVVRSFCEETGETFFDPLPVIRDYGISEALTDSNHYATPFLDVLKDRLHDAITERLAAKMSRNYSALWAGCPRSPNSA
jgi:hypothetical protein